ncbi:MAG: cyclic nucleotide-binding domain-containing protein [Desulfobacterales bacterium]
MLTIADLKDIIILSYLTDEMLERVLPVTDVLRYDQGDLVFRGGDPAERFYFLKRGKLLLEQRISDKITFSLGAVKPGYSFGWSAMLEGHLTYTTDTVCSEPCEVYSIRGVKIRNLLDSDPHMGYIFMRRMLWVVKDRLDHRTRQLVRVLRNHPDIENLL